MAKLKPEFFEGCRGVGHRASSSSTSSGTTNEKSADYSFNKSHAACYALIAYRTAWLKANYPAEYMAALISSVMDTKDKVPFFVAKAEEMGIEILPPDVNLSDHEFVVVDGNIRFGLDAVKGVGYQAVEAIKARPRGGRRRSPSIWDFCARVDARAVNKRAIEALIKCGAFGSTGASRKGMLAVLEQAQARRARSSSRTPRSARARSSTWSTAATPGGGRRPPPAFAAPTHPPIPTEEFDQPELLAVEKEAIGVFISAHPLKEVREALRVEGRRVARRARRAARTATGSRPAASSPQGKKIRTKKGDPMMFATLDDLEGSIEIAHLRQRAGASTRARSTSTRSCSSAAASTTRTRTRRASSSSRSSPSSRPRRRSRRPRRRSRRCTLGPEPFPLRVDAVAPARVVHRPSSRSSSGTSPGESDVVLEMLTAGGRRTLRLGPAYRVARTSRCAPSSSTSSAPPPCRPRSRNPRPPRPDFNTLDYCPMDRSLTSCR